MMKWYLHFWHAPELLGRMCQGNKRSAILSPCSTVSQWNCSLVGVLADYGAFWKVIYNKFDVKIYGPQSLDRVNTIPFCLCFIVIMINFLKMYTFHVRYKYPKLWLMVGNKLYFFHTQGNNHKSDKQSNQHSQELLSQGISIKENTEKLVKVTWEN